MGTLNVFRIRTGGILKIWHHFDRQRHDDIKHDGLNVFKAALAFPEHLAQPFRAIRVGIANQPVSPGRSIPIQPVGHERERRDGECRDIHSEVAAQAMLAAYRSITSPEFLMSVDVSLRDALREIQDLFLYGLLKR